MEGNGSVIPSYEAVRRVRMTCPEPLWPRECHGIEKNMFFPYGFILIS
jgi:hypothetical protein